MDSSSSSSNSSWSHELRRTRSPKHHLKKIIDAAVIVFQDELAKCTAQRLEDWRREFAASLREEIENHRSLDAFTVQKFSKDEKQEVVVSLTRLLVQARARGIEEEDYFR